MPLDVDGMRVRDGSAVVYRLYDVGYEISLPRAAAIVGPGAPTGPRRVEARALVTPAPPLRVDLGTVDVELGASTIAGRASGALFDFGVVSLRLQLPLGADLSWPSFVAVGRAIDDAASLVPALDGLLSQLMARLAPAVTRPSVAPIVEDFVVFRLSALVDATGAACRPGDVPDAALTRLLLNESRPLSPNARQELLPHRFSYTEQDFTLITWDNALVIEPDEQDQDVEYILEVANAQLLELRVFDAVLDAELPRMYDRISAARAGRHTFLRRRYQPLLSELQTLVGDVTELVERAENALKVTDDVYLARVYDAALQIFRARAWRSGIDRKLGIIQQAYSMLNDESQAVRSEALELAIVVLIVLEVVLTLLRY
jgi:hypothetical protein